jgi:hypothetical protein
MVKHSIMKNIKYFILGLLVYSSGASAQLKLTYKDVNQVLNGLKMHKEKAPKIQESLSFQHGRIDTASKDIATDLAALATMRFIADIYGEMQRQC